MGNSAGALRLLIALSSTGAVRMGMGVGDAKEEPRAELRNREREKASRLDSVRFVSVNLGILGMTVVVT
jgi:hypothetical protein